MGVSFSACAALALAMLAQSAATGPRPPDSIYFNGNIYTVDPADRRAQALAVRGDRLLAVGSDAAIRALAGPETQTHDLGGRTVLPGLIDAHGHMAGLGGFALGRVDLSAARSFEDVVTTIAERAGTARPGEWIVGGRWDHERWPGRALPTHDRLSAAAPLSPVWLTRVDGHMGLANAAALKLAGIDAETANPRGGEILRDDTGRPTGVLVDNAMELVSGMTAATRGSTADLLLKAQEICLQNGLSGVHDAGVTPDDIAVYRRLAGDGRLKMRVYLMVAGDFATEYFATHKLLISDHLTVRACKLYADGALGSRGALLLEPYADRPVDAGGKPYRGLRVTSPERIAPAIADGLARGYQVCTHAIGDGANRETLDAYEAGLARASVADHRFRIEHAQLLAPADIPRFARLGVIASMQPTHCTTDMRWAGQRVGNQRLAGAYAWGSLLRSGAHVAAGSDFPVESPNPFYGIYAAVTRSDRAGRPAGGWNPRERMTRGEALRAFTIEAAYAAFEEKQKGSLEDGKLADFIVIDRDIMTCDSDEIAETKVLRTVVGGENVFAAN